jgi:hypothetical protein
MPVFPEASLYYKGRTNTQLVVSEGNAPAEKYLASEATNMTVQFQYEFGPENNNGVVIPKGKVLAFAGVEYDVETEKYVPRVKIATGAVDELLMGVNHHNVYQRRRDRFSGSEPTVLTREYIRVPLFTGTDLDAAKAAASAIKFGAMAASANTQSAKAALYGKYVTTDANGNFVVTDTPTVANVVGQVYGIETDIPPAGFLQYFMEMNEADYNQFIKATQIVPSPGRTTDKAGTLDIQTFPVGTGYFKTSADLAMALKSFRAGIPFLTDGYFKARTNKTYELGDATNVLDIKTMGDITIADAVDTTNATSGADDLDHVYGKVANPLRKLISITDFTGTALFVRLKDKFCRDALPAYDSTRGVVPVQSNFPEYGSVAPSSISVNLLNADGTIYQQVSPANYQVDYENNLVVIYFTGLETDAGQEGVVTPKVGVSGLNVQIKATVLENQIPGIPTGWDYKGNIGEARILLMK